MKQIEKLIEADSMVTLDNPRYKSVQNLVRGGPYKFESYVLAERVEFWIDYHIEELDERFTVIPNMNVLESIEVFSTNEYVVSMIAKRICKFLDSKINSSHPVYPWNSFGSYYKKFHTSVIFDMRSYEPKENNHRDNYFYLLE